MKLRRSTIIPLVLLIYLAIMCWIGRGELAAGNYLYYFGIVGVTLIAIGLLHLTLRQRERQRARMRRRRRRQQSNDAHAD